MGSPPPVSIGLPVYNGARFLGAALDSILGQTYTEFDLFVSDNGSTDETAEICRDYAARDSRIRYVRHDVNQGAARNYNLVYHETQGRFFKWAAHDDVLAPTHLERCLEELAAAPQAAVVHPRTRWIDEAGEVIGELEHDIELRQPTAPARLAAFARSFIYGNAAFGLMRRSALDRTHLLGTFPSADFVMLAELAIVGEIHQVPEFLFFRRNHPKMSRRANATSREVAEWFVPGSGRRRVHERSTVLVETMRAIRTAPVDRAERARLYGRFLSAWLPGNAVPMLRERLGRG